MSRKTSLASAASAGSGASSDLGLGMRNIPVDSASVSSVSSKSSVVISEEGVRLRKHLGLTNGVGIIVGIIVGSGIFVSPKGVLLQTGSVGGALIVWILCGTVCLIGAMCYAELGTAILKSGADYAYINEAYGNFPSFLYLWVAVVVVLPTGNAITALTFATYVLQAFFPKDCPPPDIAISLVAAMCISRCLPSLSICFYLCVYVSVYTISLVAAMCISKFLPSLCFCLWVYVSVYTISFVAAMCISRCLP